MPPDQRTTSRGPVGPPAFFDALTGIAKPRASRSNPNRPAAFRVPPSRAALHKRKEEPMSALLTPIGAETPPNPGADLMGRQALQADPRLAGRPELGPPALLVENVTKRFNVGRKRPPVLAINRVSMRLERGQVFGILGANGSGKSTLIRLVSGLLTLDEGRVEVFGHDLAREEMAVKRLINRVSVDAAFFKKLSPMENLQFAARLYGLDPKNARRDAIRILERLGISEKRT